MSGSEARKRRADAQRSAESVVGAAIQVLNRDPDASMGAIAAAAGVTRQTVYAHFSSREKLLRAVVDHLTAETVAEIDAEDIDTGPAMDALFRLLDASERTVGRYPVLFQSGDAAATTQSADDQRHDPVADRLSRIFRRGQQSGEFDAHISVTWLVAATIKLSHTASEETDAGRLSEHEADAALRTSLRRILTPD
ncbi:TetR/AcrR family transcriptional regulator [Spiractinospora alimapuensis]|uniref:TetR/AcrR family transcriptional regulator n=1 Tax=Spiractinospora alimapuensis TaxID=2820884 RepID=UPI001F1A393C|nr:TetR/AcrR family transcriptional regulator [Spiractinospora alimapuensis]QVQ54442.1 TetR/AcrR family transcriptional regulator [Spiractinospora alimapuensis]